MRKNRPFSQLSDLSDLDPGSGHTAHERVALNVLYLRTKFHSNRKNFLWTDIWRSQV